MNVKRIILIGVLLSICTVSVTQTILVTALPTIVEDIGGIHLYSWVVGAYLLAYTAPSLIFGKLGDQYGWKLILLVGMTLFTIGNLLCLFATSMNQVILYRIIQGVGAGMTGISGLAAMGEMFQGTLRAKMIGYLGIVQVLANIIGPFAGGVITDYIGWRWNFILLIPIGLVAMLCVVSDLKVKVHAKVQDSKPINWWGFIALGLGPAIALFGFQLIQSKYVWIGGIAIFVGMLIIFVAIRYEKDHPNPIIPRSFMKQRKVKNALLGAFIVGLLHFGAITYIPLLAYEAIGNSAMGAASLLWPMVISAGVASWIGGKLAGYLPYHSIAIFGWLMTGIGLLGLGIDSLNHSIWLQIATTFVGFGMGVILPTLLVTVQNSVASNANAIAGGILQMSRNFGGAVGVPLLALFNNSFGVASLFSPTGVFIIMALFSCVGILVTWLLAERTMVQS